MSNFGLSSWIIIFSFVLRQVQMVVEGEQRRAKWTPILPCATLVFCLIPLRHESVFFFYPLLLCRRLRQCAVPVWVILRKIPRIAGPMHQRGRQGWTPQNCLRAFPPIPHLLWALQGIAPLSRNRILMTGPSIDCSIDWLIRMDVSIDWLIDWLVFDWLIDWLIGFFLDFVSFSSLFRHLTVAWFYWFFCCVEFTASYLRTKIWQWSNKSTSHWCCDRQNCGRRCHKSKLTGFVLFAWLSAMDLLFFAPNSWHFFLQLSDLGKNFPR